MRKQRAIVIGAGVGGLTAAMKLAHDGYQVEVHEKLSGPGGRCGRVSLGGGFQFDLGPTILLMPHVLEETFASVGLKLSDFLQLQRCDPNYRVRYADGSEFSPTSELSKMREELERIEPGSFERYLRFMATARDQHDTALTRFVGAHFDSLAQFLKPSTLRHALRIGAHRKMAAQVGTAFKDERLQQAFSFQTMYLGVSPYEAPAVFALLPYTELALGIWFPSGGMFAIPQALERACLHKGVQLCYRSSVSSVTVEGGRAVGVALADGSMRRADVVLCNADFAWASEHLLPERYAVPRTKKLARARYTSSGYMLYWGLKKRYDALLHHNVFFGRDYATSFDDIFERHRVPEDLSFYVNAPAHTDAAMAPAGKDAIYVLVPVPHRHDSLDWKIEGPRVRAKVLRRLAAEGYPDIEADLEVERIVTPDEWEGELNLKNGSAFGLAQNLFQVGPFRPKVWDEQIANLFYCGASVQPGTGVPTVMVSARLACEAIAARAVPGVSALEADVAASAVVAA